MLIVEPKNYTTYKALLRAWASAAGAGGPWPLLDFQTWYKYNR